MNLIPTWFRGDLTAWAIHVCQFQWNCAGVVKQLRRPA